MLRQCLLALTLLLPSAASAQLYLQNESTVEYSLRTYVTKLSDTQYRYTALVRNEQGYSPTEVYGINNMYFYGLPCCTSDAYVSSATHYFVGTVGTSIGAPVTPRVNPAYPNDAMHYQPNTFEGGGLYPDVAYTGTDFDSFIYGYGLLGCTGPVTFARTENNYAGSTCAAGGFSGWLGFDFTITFASARNFTGSGLTTDVVGHYETERAAFGTFNVVPEPSTYVLVGAGLMLVAVVRRKRFA